MKTKRLVLVLVGAAFPFMPALSQAGSATVKESRTTSVTRTEKEYYKVRYQVAPACYKGHYGLVNYPWGAVIYYPNPAVNQGFKAY